MATSEHDVASCKDDMDTTENPIVHSDEMYGITTEIILKHKEMLTDTLQDTKYGILEKLVASGGLTRRETTAIECSKDPYKRSRKLIDVVVKKNILSQFIKALVDTNQQHLVNYLRGDGVRNVECGDDWPLTEDRIKQLDMNHEHLIDIIDPCTSGLIYMLFSTNVISNRQLSFISEESSSVSKNKALLDIIRRQSVKDYDRTIVCLTKTKQERVAETMQGSGVICRIHVSQEGDPEIVNEIEVAFSDRFADSLRGLSIEEVQRILEMTHLKVIEAQKGKSIYLYVYCATLEELMELHNLLVTGDIKTIVETLFNKLVSRKDLIVASCTYSEEEFDKCKSYFEGEILGAHINTTRPDKEDDIAKLLNDLIADPKSCEEKHDLKELLNELNDFHIPIVSAESKHSIVVYTYCKTPEDMKSYVRLLNSGRLQTVFENILNLLLKELEGENFQPLQAAVMIEEEDRMLIQQFTGLDAAARVPTALGEETTLTTAEDEISTSLKNLLGDDEYSRCSTRDQQLNFLDVKLDRATMNSKTTTQTAVVPGDTQNIDNVNKGRPVDEFHR